MPIDPFTGTAIAQGVGTGINTLYRIFNRPKSFEDTAYGRRLKRLSEVGMYSPSVTSSILGRVGKETATAGQQAKTAYKGRLISSGFEGSIAGERGLAEIDTSRMRTIGEKASEIEEANALSKEKYKTEYAQAKDRYREGLRGYDQGTVTGFIEGAGNVAGTLLKGQQYKEEMGLKDRQLGIREGEVDNRGKYYDYLNRKLDEGGMPDVTKTNAGDINQWIFNAKTEEEIATRKELIKNALKKAGIYEQYLEAMGLL